MVTTIYEPEDTRFRDLFSGLAPGLFEAGRGIGKRKRQGDRADAITQLLSEPGQTQEAIVTKLMSSPEFADDPQSAIQMATSLWEARQNDLQGKRAKGIIDNVIKANRDAFQGVDVEQLSDLPPDQLMEFANTLLDAQSDKAQLAATTRGQDIQEKLGLEGLQVQRQGIAADSAQAAAQLAETTASRQQQAEQFEKGFSLDAAKTRAELLRNDAEIAQTQASTRLTQIEADFKAATSDDEKAKLVEERDNLKAQTKYTQALSQKADAEMKLAVATAPAEIAKAESDMKKADAEVKKIEAELANLPAEKAKLEAETAKAQAEAEKAKAEAAGGLKGQKEFEAAAQATAKAFGVPVEQAVRMNQVEPQALNLVAATYGGKYDPSDPFLISGKATPEDKSKGMIAVSLVKKSLAETNADTGAAVSLATDNAEKIYTEISKALPGSNEESLPVDVARVYGVVANTLAKASDEQALSQVVSSLSKMGYSLKVEQIGDIMDLVDEAR